VTVNNRRTTALRNGNRQLLVWRLMLGLVLVETAYLMREQAAASEPVGGFLFSCGLLVAGLVFSYVGIVLEMTERRLLVIQLTLDVLTISLLAHFSGGVSAGFLLFLCVPILLGGYFLGARAALILGGLSGVGTLAAHGAYAAGWLPSAASTSQAVGGLPSLTAVLHAGLFLWVGKLGGMMAARTDSGERLQYQATAQMQRARSEVRNILDNMGSGLLIVDSDGTITRANPAATSMLGLRTTEIIGQPLQPALGSDRAELAECVIAVLQGGAPVPRHEVTIHLGETEVPLGLSVSRIEDEDGVLVGAIAIFRDLTEIRRMEERIREADRLAGLGELAASIAHEIRNPLASIRGSVELLDSELSLTGHQEKLLKLILKESGRVNTIINDFLAYARLRPPAPRLLKAANLLEDVALQVRQHVGVHGGGVRLAHRVEPSDLALRVDPEQLTQLLLNLAINACEAMEYKGELELTVTEGVDGKTCELWVRDSGPGLPIEVREDIFKPFITSKRSGTGLGLPMVARIAHAHGGSVEAGASEFGGAAFCVRLPRPPRRTEPIRAEAQPASERREPVGAST
jgi:two-component system sensor histidine kinase PilS (NtrC family)